MRQIIELLRLKYEACLSHERVARACGLSKGVVGKYVSLVLRQPRAAARPLPLIIRSSCPGLRNLSGSSVEVEL